VEIIKANFDNKVIEKQEDEIVELEDEIEILED
jgi:hypothetical protein